jgi:3-hydroxybutyryl-CoA dehydratase
MTTAPAPFRFAPLTRTDIVRYAGASGDFNPLHHDAVFASEAGYPDVMAHGMLSAGMLASAVTSWFGTGNLRRFSVRFAQPVWPGDCLTATCGIVSTQQTEGGKLADLDLTLMREPGDIVITGSAQVFLVGG